MHEMNLPDHWKVVRLGEVTEIIKGGTPSRSVETYFQGNIAWAIPSDITALDSALYIHDTASHISEEGLNKSAAKLLPSGTVLLTSRATIGETAISTISMATNQGFSNFICNDKILNVYLAYYLRHIKQKLNILASGSTFKEVTKGTLLNVEIPLPPLPEQRVIAHVLQTIQEAKFTRQREIALERERKAALMDHLFSHGTNGEPRKQTEIGEIPESWTIQAFGDCLKEVKSKKVPFIPKRDYQESGEFPIIDQGTAFIAGWTDLTISVIFDDLPVIIFGDHTRIFKYVDFPFAVGAQGTQILYPNDDVLDACFFYYALLGLKVPNKGYNRHYKYLREFSIPCPSLPEQQQIANILQIIDEKTAALEREVEHLDEFFHAMLDELMTGQRSTVPLIDVGLLNSQDCSYKKDRISHEN